VLRFAIVKDTLLLPLRYVIVLLILILILSGLFFLAGWGSFFDPDHGPPATYGAVLALRALHACFPVSALLAILITLFALLRSNGSRLISLILLFAVSTAALVSGMMFLEQIENRMPQPEAPPAYGIQAGVLNRLPSAYLYIDAKEGQRLSRVLVHEDGKVPGFTLYPSGVQDPYRHTLLIPNTGTVYDLEEMRYSIWTMFDAPPVLQKLFHQVGIMNSTLYALLNGSRRDFFAVAGGLTLLFTLMWAAVRLTRWPLFNSLIVLALFLGTFVIFRGAQSERVSSMLSAVLTPRALGYVLPGALAACSLILLVIIAVMPPFHHWKREVGSG